RATITTVPTIAGAIPPPGPNAGGLWVRKCQLSAAAPCATTAKITIPSTAMASTAAAVAPVSATRFTIWRRRRLPEGLSAAARSGRSSRHRPLDVEAPPNPLGEQIGDHADHEQHRAEIEKCGDLQLGGGSLELVRDAAGERVARGEQGRVDRVAGADHLGDRDRLAKRPAEAQEARRGHSRSGRREHHTSNRLPARGA